MDVDMQEKHNNNVETELQTLGRGSWDKTRKVELKIMM